MKLTKRGRVVTNTLIMAGMAGMLVCGMFADGDYWWQAWKAGMGFSLVALLGIAIQIFTNK